MIIKSLDDRGKKSWLISHVAIFPTRIIIHVFYHDDVFHTIILLMRVAFSESRPGCIAFVRQNMQSFVEDSKLTSFFIKNSNFLATTSLRHVALLRSTFNLLSQFLRKTKENLNLCHKIQSKFIIFVSLTIIIKIKIPFSQNYIKKL